MSISLTISEDVSDALSDGRPVIALETSLIAQGLPYPRSVEVAQDLHNTIRDLDAVPAMTAVLDGKVRVGLGEEDVERLATRQEVLKGSRRDLGYAIASGVDAATTVAATMIISRLAGIRVFATGGIGGVHRGYERTLDVSADLQELAQTPVAVVCAGAKAILDLPRTLEYLETGGIPVFAYGADAFPGFYVRDSGLPSPYRLDTPDACASAIAAHWGLALNSGVLVANPPPEDTALSRDRFEEALAIALNEAEAKGVRGKEITPFLLDRIADLTGGDSLDTNAALVLSNARLATEIAHRLTSMS